MKKNRPHGRGRIILSIALKDIQDGLKNRTILTLAFGVLFLMLSPRVLPLLLSARAVPTLVVYEPDGPAAAMVFDATSEMRILPVRSEDELTSRLIETQQVMIGVVLPADLWTGSGEMVLDGYAAYWASPADVRELAERFGQALSAASGRPVRIETAGNRIYASLTTGTHLAISSQTIMLMIVLMCMMLVPFLLLEEKEQRTLDALLVSPASHTDLVVGKALAGTGYGLIAGGVALAVNYRLIVHWEIAGLAVLLGGGFAVLTGLLLGLLVDNQASLGMWMSLLAVLLIGPAVALSFGGSRIPENINTILAWTPGAACNELIRIAMCGEVPAALAGRDAAVLAVSMLLVFGLIVWRVRRMDR